MLRWVLEIVSGRLCNMQVNQMFGGDWMKNYQTDLPDQLESGIKRFMLVIRTTLQLAWQQGLDVGDALVRTRCFQRC